jgi:hypothetical protein
MEDKYATDTSNHLSRAAFCFTMKVSQSCEENRETEIKKQTLHEG